jgi:aminoglycoside 3-N-acetyltransferase
LFHGFKFDKKLSRNEQLTMHYQAIKELVEKRPLWMPSFNYDFTKSGIYDIQQAPSEVGILSEFFRMQIAKWRSPVPVFSFTGDDEPPAFHDNLYIDPFGETSLFHQLVQDNALLIYYGTTNINSSTIIHYCESVSGALNYRYEKIFKGAIITDDSEKQVVLKMHVRPKGLGLNYDWKRLEDNLKRKSILHEFKNHRFDIKVIRVIDICNHWIAKMQEDPLYFLDDESRGRVEEKLQKLGHPFLISDFE